MGKKAYVVMSFENFNLADEFFTSINGKAEGLIQGRVSNCVKPINDFLKEEESDNEEFEE